MLSNCFLGNYRLMVLNGSNTGGIKTNEYPSIEEAARETGVHKDTISRCCKHWGYYKSAGGYKWEYK